MSGVTRTERFAFELFGSGLAFVHHPDDEVKKTY